MTTATATQAQPKVPTVAEVARSEDTLAKQIAEAMEVGEKAGAVAKGKDTKLQNKVERGVAEKRQAKEAPAPEPDETEEAANDTEHETESEEADEEKPEKGGKHKFLSQAKLRGILEEEGLDAALEAAFGKKPGDFNINSKRWEEWRKANQRSKRQIAEREQQLTGFQQQLQGAHAQLKRDYELVKPILEARQLYERGDISGALKAAFGADASDFNKKLLRSHMGDAARDPAVDELRRELIAERAERQREREAQAEQQRQATVAEHTRNYRAQMVEELRDSGDEQLARFAKKPRFLDHIISIQREHYDHRNRTTLPVLEAADLARQAILEEFGDVFGEPRDVDESTVSGRGGSIPAKAVARATKTLSQRGAAEAGPPLKNGKQMSVDELADYFADQHNKNIGRAPIRQRA